MLTPKSLRVTLGVNTLREWTFRAFIYPFLPKADQDMVSLTISSPSKPPPFARGFPLTVDVPNDATIADVKAAIAAKFPKVSASYRTFNRVIIILT